MINLEKSKELRIKRANTDWWIHEKAMVGNNGKTYIVYSTDMGEIHIKELDAKCSRSVSRDFCLCRLNCNYADEHNSPSVCVMENGKIIVAYTGHAATHTLKYRVTERPYDIFSFGPEHTLHYSQSVTYAQLSENTAKGQLWLFCRVRGVTWEFRYSEDEGESWSEPTKFLESDAGGLFYFDIRRQLTPKGEQWMFALYGHPRISKDHTIRSGIFNADGDLLTMDGEPAGMNLYEGGKLSLPELAKVYESPEGTTCRLLVVSPTQPYRVGLASFELNKPETIRYFSATWRDGCWNLSAPIADGGEFLSPDTMIDGSQTYVGGMAYYWGVGEAGLYPRDKADTETNRIYIARFDGEARVLESYISLDWGKTYTLEQVIRRIPREENIKIWRPTVPAYAQDNMPVYWHEGSYGAHTGGWHCDAVMYAEYDD
ncbi:MAG: BNR-4 repeat-containing protein [Clostridia bacterium]|nr:BNR-4 repeat-containing protein [Clostridia bacterium]